MNTTQLIEQVKLRLNDEIEPYAFGDDDILVALNDAQNEFAQSTLCLFESDTTIIGGASNGFITTPVGVLWITAASISTSLRIVTQHELEFGYFDLPEAETSTRFSNWRQAEGTPLFCLPDYGVQNMRLVPKPLSDVTVELEFYRLPAVAMSAVVNPEIPTPYHSDLVIGALAYLFDIPDQEFYSLEVATLKQVAWQKRIAIAARLLQTELRMQIRHIQPPPGIGFILPTGTN